MDRSREPEPERPRSAGVPEEVPDTSGIEGARLLANEAFPRLKSLGFTRRQVRLWAETYVADEDSGDLESFLAWVRTKEGSAGSD
jgi:hypothetical protein